MNPVYSVGEEYCSLSAGADVLVPGCAVLKDPVLQPSSGPGSARPSGLVVRFHVLGSDPALPGKGCPG